MKVIAINRTLMLLTVMYLFFFVLFALMLTLIYKIERDYSKVVSSDSMLKIVSKENRMISFCLTFLSGIETLFCPLILLVSFGNLDSIITFSIFSKSIYYTILLAFVASEFISFYFLKNANRYFNIAFWCLGIFNLIQVFEDKVPGISFLQYTDIIKYVVVFTFATFGCRSMAKSNKVISILCLVFTIMLPILSVAAIIFNIQSDFYHFGDLTISLTDSTLGFLYIIGSMIIYLCFGTILFLTSIEIKKPKLIESEIEKFGKEGEEYNDK